MDPQTTPTRRMERDVPPQLPRVVGVQLDGSDHVEYVTVGRLSVDIGDDVMVTNRRGRRVGMVVTRPRHATPFESERGLGRLQRLAAAGDVQQVESGRSHERDDLHACIHVARQNKLKMKVITAERGKDDKVLLYFAAEERLDVRELGRVFSRELHLRVDLKEVSQRDEAKVIGACGPCGRELCCSTFLRAPGGVSLKMAKAQGLSPHPSRLAGMCGRLKCCLKYEYDTYVGLGKALPAVGLQVESVKAEGTVVRQNLLKQTVVIRNPEGVETEVTLEDLVAKKAP